MTAAVEPRIDVLLVEDDDDDAAVVERLLTASGMSRGSGGMIEVAAIDRVARVEDALAMFNQHKPTVVLLDLGLPDSGGIDTVEAVVNAAPHVSIVVLTGRMESELGPQAIQKGAQDYLTKGRITEEVLRRSLRYAIDRHESQLELLHANSRLELLNEILRQDIRNDASAIIGWGEDLENHVDDDRIPSVRRLLKAARHAAGLADAASELVDALSMDEQIESKPVALDDVLEPEIVRVRDRSDADLMVDRSGIGRDSVFVRGTPMLSSAFEQLLSNAIRHTDRDTPHVAIHIHDGDDRVAVVIKDDGVGIPDGQKEMLNGSETRYEGRSGIGTGLYLATSVLEQVDGGISFADNYPRGTKVIVELHPAMESE